MKQLAHGSKTELGLMLSLIVPSLGTVYKYTGLHGTALYVLAVAGVLWVGKKNVFEWFRSTINDRIALSLLGVTFLAIIAAFVTIYPIANSGAVGGGSDADDALDIGATELLNGRYPFYVKTYLGNPIAPLPGAIFLAFPFVLLGTSAYQNFCWLGVFFIVSKRILNDVRSALLLLWTILALSPVVMAMMVTGSDDFSNAIYVLFFILALVFWVTRTDQRIWKPSVAAGFLGLAMASRANFLLLLPLVCIGVARRAGWRAAFRDCAVAVVTFLLCVVPFWGYDPNNFSPVFNQFSKVSQFDYVLPFSGVLIPLLMGLVAVATAYTYTESDASSLLKKLALVLAIPVLCTTALSVSTVGMSGLIWTNYGVFFLPFGALAFWARALATNSTAIPSRHRWSALVGQVKISS
jgi:hypothetical protein